MKYLDRLIMKLIKINSPVYCRRTEIIKPLRHSPTRIAFHESLPEKIKKLVSPGATISVYANRCCIGASVNYWSKKKMVPSFVL